MSIEWKKGPPPKDEAGTWLVWSLCGGGRLAFRITPGRDLRVHDTCRDDEPAAGWEASITHHLPRRITPPEEESPTPSPREGAEGSESVKTHFNDPRPNRATWELDCPDCRARIEMHIENYPHGPNVPTRCPVCGQWCAMARRSTAPERS